MARTSNVFARVEPEIKSEAENVLNQLGIPMSNAIGMFLRQVVIQRGIPFEMKLRESSILDYDKLTRDQFDAEMQHAFDELETGQVIPAETVHAQMNRVNRL